MPTVKHTFMDIFDTDFVFNEEIMRVQKIVIPIIQRDYAQGREDEATSRIRRNFLAALYEAVTESPITLDFIYGDIDQDGTLTPLDGQQRLTTLFLLHWYAAKIGGVEESEYAFLRNFSYKTRYSARDFCERLVWHVPDWDSKLSDDVTDQAWFPFDWQKDATISAMLVMLDAIQGKFADVPDLWEKLKDGAISFYFLPIKEMGLTDELYIKMNSRGKLLTPFEHFKAELERELRVLDSEVCDRIIRKIDIDWTDMLWQYRGEDNVTDDEFIRYTRFICDIIRYKAGGTTQGKGFTELDLIKEFFAADREDALDNILTLEQFFDIWCKKNLSESPSDFMDRFIATEHEVGKITIADNHNLFRHCLEGYADVYGNKNRKFPLNRIVLLYAFVEYLTHKDAISEEQFARRLRMVHNLVRNSEYEISDSIQRTSGNRMPAILQQVDVIVLKGRIDKSIKNSFNAFQLKEEAEKLKWTRSHEEYAEELFELEDHGLLTGQISIVGLEEPRFFGRFAELFDYDCDSWDAVDCAMLALGDYTQKDRNGWRYQIGSGYMEQAWINLFHYSEASSGYEATKEILRKLLAVRGRYSDEMLYAIGEKYLAKCEAKGEFDWRYYYIKYEEFRPDRYGKIEWGDKKKPYEMLMLHSEFNPSLNSYQPFLKAIGGGTLWREYSGRRLIVGEYWIECANEGFYAHNMSDDEVVGQLNIKQNEAGVDLEDRVKKAKRWYKKYKK